MFDYNNVVEDMNGQAGHMAERGKLVECCFCGARMEKRLACNPWPANADEGARCCPGCNAAIVVPARAAYRAEV